MKPLIGIAIILQLLPSCNSLKEGMSGNRQYDDSIHYLIIEISGSFPGLKEILNVINKNGYAEDVEEEDNDIYFSDSRIFTIQMEASQKQVDEIFRELNKYSPQLVLLYER